MFNDIKELLIFRCVNSTADVLRVLIFLEIYAMKYLQTKYLWDLLLNYSCPPYLHFCFQQFQIPTVDRSLKILNRKF